MYIIGKDLVNKDKVNLFADFVEKHIIITWMEKLNILKIELSDIINQDGDDVTDGECIDQIVEYLKSKNLYNERK